LKGAVASAVCSGAETVLQQECEDGMVPWSHWSAISRQQADSSEVAPAGSTHAKSGVAAKTVIIAKMPSLVMGFN
jgi:hypothetical protein